MCLHAEAIHQDVHFSRTRDDVQVDNSIEPGEVVESQARCLGHEEADVRSTVEFHLRRRTTEDRDVRDWERRAVLSLDLQAGGTRVWLRDQSLGNAMSERQHEHDQEGKAGSSTPTSSMTAETGLPVGLGSSAYSNTGGPSGRSPTTSFSSARFS